MKFDGEWKDYWMWEYSGWGKLWRNNRHEIKERIDLCGYKVKHIAKMIGVTELRMSDILNGRVHIGETEHDDIIRFLEIAENANAQMQGVFNVNQLIAYIKKNVPHFSLIHRKI